MVFKKLKNNKIKPCGKKRKLFGSTMVIIHLLFSLLSQPQSTSASSNYKNGQFVIGSKASISRDFSQNSWIIDDSNQDNCLQLQSESILEGSQRIVKIPSGYTIIILRGGASNASSSLGKFSPGSKARGAARTNFMRRQTQTQTGNTTSNSGGSVFTNAFTVPRPFSSPSNGNGFELFGKVPSQKKSQPKPGRGPRVNSISTRDENGEIKTIHYDKNGQIIDRSDESKFLDDVDLAKDENSNSTDQHIQSDTKTQAEDAQNPNSGLTKARKSLTLVKNDKITSEGNYINPSKLTSKGRVIQDKTKDRRTAPVLQSRYEDRNKKFSPAYSLKQGANKNKHTREVLKKLGQNVTRYNELPASKQSQVDLTIVEGLLGHRDTELYTNVMGQWREPIVLVLNRGHGDYPLPNHIGTFERRPEISEYNHYISNYLADELQIEGFDLSNNTSITYEDLIGNSHTNIGPVFGKDKTNSSTSTSTVDDVNPEL